MKPLDQEGMKRATEIADKIALLLEDEDTTHVLAALALATAAACIVVGGFPLVYVYTLARAFHNSMTKEEKTCPTSPTPSEATPGAKPPTKST